ncbi:hypothetical protein HPB48_027100 [Haemaphysalis longicornis]|uniref:Uncharacterized protein n=1 Tax=Haemaphysalis longicornis TaxID=44386 RepID=A0A9J6HDZ0_HAELO|nr:hypothetical protein HPB48_027100 [Haemaphysalis longicornis]
MTKTWTKHMTLLTWVSGEGPARHLKWKTGCGALFYGDGQAAMKIPVGYFFTGYLMNEKLFCMTIAVFKAFKDVGFLVTRVATDNPQTNTARFSSLSEAATLIVYAVPHPLKKGDRLFLSSEYSHPIKIMRTNFLE